MRSGTMAADFFDDPAQQSAAARERVSRKLRVRRALEDGLATGFREYRQEAVDMR